METGRAGDEPALIRRFIGLVPFIGGFTDWVPIPYHFDFKRGDTILSGPLRGAQLRDALPTRVAVVVARDPGRWSKTDQGKTRARRAPQPCTLRLVNPRERKQGNAR